MLIFRKTLRTYLTDDLLCNDWLILQWFNYCGKQTFALMLINHRYLKHCMQFVWIILVDYSSSFQGFCQRFLFTFLVSIRYQVINYVFIPFSSLMSHTKKYSSLLHMAHSALFYIPQYMPNLQLPFNNRDHLERSAFQTLENQLLLFDCQKEVYRVYLHLCFRHVIHFV